MFREPGENDTPFQSSTKVSHHATSDLASCVMHVRWSRQCVMLVQNNVCDKVCSSAHVNETVK